MSFLICFRQTSKFALFAARAFLHRMLAVTFIMVSATAIPAWPADGPPKEVLLKQVEIKRDWKNYSETKDWQKLIQIQQVKMVDIRQMNDTGALSAFAMAHLSSLDYHSYWHLREVSDLMDKIGVLEKGSDFDKEVYLRLSQDAVVKQGYPQVAAFIADWLKRDHDAAQADVASNKQLSALDRELASLGEQIETSKRQLEEMKRLSTERQFMAQGNHSITYSNLEDKLLEDRSAFTKAKAERDGLAAAFKSRPRDNAWLLGEPYESAYNFYSAQAAVGQGK